MSWIHIPKEQGERISQICNQHFVLKGQCDCPLWDACNYANDLSKSSSENTRIFERGMVDALEVYELTENGLDEDFCRKLYRAFVYTGAAIRNGVYDYRLHGGTFGIHILRWRNDVPARDMLAEPRFVCRFPNSFVEKFVDEMKKP